jgi:hypothetical protein
MIKKTRWCMARQLPLIEENNLKGSLAELQFTLTRGEAEKIVL